MSCQEGADAQSDGQVGLAGTEGPRRTASSLAATKSSVPGYVSRLRERCRIRTLPRTSYSVIGRRGCVPRRRERTGKRPE